MSDIRFFLDNAWRRVAGLPEIELNQQVDPTKAFVRFDENFTNLMRNRIGMGYFRYGGDTKSYRYVDGILLKVKRYIETGNTEFLVDAANYCMLEFNIPSLDNTYFKSVDNDNSHLDEYDSKNK